MANTTKVDLSKANSKEKWNGCKVQKNKENRKNLIDSEILQKYRAILV